MIDLKLTKTDLLKTKLSPFNFSEPPVDPTELATALIGLMNKHNGLGLAANQCGLPHRVFVIRGAPNYVCFNPVLVDHGDKQVVMEEGCLSFPGLIVKVKRPETIRMRFATPSGETVTKTFSGMTARVAQHELDHLEGVLFYDRASLLHRVKAFKDKKLYDRRKNRR